MAGSGTTHACFTINNFEGDKTLEMLRTYFLKPENHCNYLVSGREHENGILTPHLQGYLQWTRRTRWANLAKLWKAHIETAVGTHIQASEYCKKEGEFIEMGEIRDEQAAIAKGRKKGGLMEKARWARVNSLAKDGNLDTIDIEEPALYLRFYKTLKEIAKDHMPRIEPLERLSNMWIHGASGVGKSVLARLVANNKYYPKMANKWWDGYLGESVIVIDDLDANHACLGHHLKVWGDHQQFIAEVKGGGLMLRPKAIIVTSQYSIKDIWPDIETQEALGRRYHQEHLIGTFTNEHLTDLSIKLQTKYNLPHADAILAVIEHFPEDVLPVEEVPVEPEPLVEKEIEYNNWWPVQEIIDIGDDGDMIADFVYRRPLSPASIRKELRLVTAACKMKNFAVSCAVVPLVAEPVPKPVPESEIDEDALSFDLESPRRD